MRDLRVDLAASADERNDGDHRFASGEVLQHHEPVGETGVSFVVPDRLPPDRSATASLFARDRSSARVSCEALDNDPVGLWRPSPTVVDSGMAVARATA